MGDKLNENEKEGLSPEEIEAIESEEGDDLDDLLPEDELKAEEEKQDKAESEAKDQEEADAKAKAAEAEEPKPGEEPEKKEETTKSADEPAPFVPQVKVVDDAKLNELKTKFDEAKKKFEDGDIDYAELDEAKDAYNQAKWKKEYSEESNASMREARWKWEQENFLDANKDFKDNDTLHVAFVAAVNNLIASDEGKAMSDREVLEAAKKKVHKDLGVLKPSGDDGTKEKERQNAIRKAKEKMSDKTNIPQDIGGLPEAEENSDEKEFAYLDRLDGERLQAAVDRMTPAQLARYEDAR